MRHHQEERKHLRELKWQELVTRMNAYRFYIKLILEINAFFYATTGAVLLFYLKQQIDLNQHNNYSEFFLLLPIVMGTVVGGFLIYAAALQRHNSKIIDRIRADLGTTYEMHIQDIPDLSLLDRLLRVFGNIFFLVAGSLSWVPLLMGLSWWDSVTVRARNGLAAFTVTGFFIAVAGWIFSMLMACKYDKKVLRSSMAANGDKAQTKQSDNLPQPEV